MDVEQHPIYSLGRTKKHAFLFVWLHQLVKFHIFYRDFTPLLKMTTNFMLLHTVHSLSDRLLCHGGPKWTQSLCGTSTCGCMKKILAT
jgi:hypothetical protein